MTCLSACRIRIRLRSAHVRTHQRERARQATRVGVGVTILVVQSFENATGANLHKHRGPWRGGEPHHAKPPQTPVFRDKNGQA